MKRIWNGLTAAAFGGLVAGLALGFVETMTYSVLGNGWSGFSVLFWALAAYGLLGFLSGALLGFLGSIFLGRWLPSHPNWWVLVGGAAILGGAGTIVVRFRLLRDLLQEQASLLSSASLALHGALLIVFGGIFVLAWWIGRRWTRPAAVMENRPTSPTDGEVSRRAFLKAGLASGVVAIPAMAAASRLLEHKPSGLTVIHRTGLPATLRSKPNMIFLMIDTLRADHMGAYGYDKAVTPHLDALAAESILFTNSLTQSSWTKPSVATMLTSLYPSSHKTIYKKSALPHAAVTLPEILSTNGYVAGGFANNVNLAPLFNFDQGFSDYEFLAPDYLLGASEASSQLAVYQTARMVNARFLKSRKNVHHFYQPAEVVNERAMAWLTARQEERFFLFLHYMEPHDPYFEHPYSSYGIARVSTPHPSPDMAPEIVRLYDGEIAYMDQRLGELFGWLKKQGLYDETLIVLTADHGEEFYEHGGWWHGLTLFDEQIRVPLLLKMPKQQMAGTVDTDITRSLDIAPTLLRAAGFDVPQAMQGLDLLGETPRPQLSFAEEDHQGNVLYSISGPSWKLIEANEGNPRGLPLRSLYHIAQDRGEMHDLYEAERDKAAQMSAHIEKTAALALAQAVTGDQVELDEATAAQLRSLGY
jgi:arylsulfatase A-like enzyme